MEEWRAVVGYEGLYEVSNLGRVRSLPKYNHPTTRILTPTLNKKRGRYSVLLCPNHYERKRVSVHRLVAMAFVKNPDPERFTEINHKDENPLNNNANNLEWCDRWYNMHYNNLHDRISRPQRKQVIGRKANGETIRFNSLTEADKNGFCKNVLSKIVNKRERKRRGTFYKGYFWEVAKCQ